MPGVGCRIRCGRAGCTIVAAEKTSVVASIGATAGNVQVTAHVGDAVRIGWLTQTPGTDGNKFGWWHKGTIRTEARAPYRSY